MISSESKELRLAERLADIARETTLKHFRQSISIESKQDSSPVTIADKETESRLRKEIRKTFPEHGIAGEEFATENAGARFSWILDPIDGTGSFISGNPLFGALICLSQKNKVILGLIEMPALGERWIGYGGRSYFNKNRCKTSPCTALKDARLITTSPDMFNQLELQKFNALSQRVSIRRFGGDCYCYALLASGHIDLVVESDLKRHDYMALVAVVEGAGGIITDWQGNPLSKLSGQQVLAAANREIHQQALHYLRN